MTPFTRTSRPATLSVWTVRREEDLVHAKVRLGSVLIVTLAVCGVTAPLASGFGLGGIPASDAVRDAGPRPSLSADGRYLAFRSQGLFLGGSGSYGDAVFVRDTQTGNTALVSRASGAAGERAYPGSSIYGSITPSGRYVVFTSQGSNLSPDDPDQAWDVFVRDTQTGTTTLVSRASGAAGAKGNGNLYSWPIAPSISADGRYVAFDSSASNLSPDDVDSIPDVYVRDLQAHTTTLVSDTGGVPGAKGANGSFRGAISADGRYVAFDSDSKLSPDDPDSLRDVYVRDLQAHTTTLVSRAGGVAGVKGNSYSSQPSISADGRYMAFRSVSTNLSPDDADAKDDVYVRDLQTQTTTLVSRATGAAGAKDNSGGWSGEEAPSISADGRYVAFDSQGTNLSPDDTDASPDVYVRDLQAATTTLASRAGGVAGAKAVGNAIYGTMSPDGRFVAFGSYSGNLAPDSYGGNVFVRDLQDHATWLESRGTAGYPRPKGATPLLVPLVPAYEPCGPANRTHGPPLSFGSCSPPAPSSGLLTVGTPDANGQGAKSTGSVRLANLGYDVSIEVNARDVRNAGDLSDYTGELRLSATLRATDRLSPVNADDQWDAGPATVQDIGFGPAVPCDATGDSSVGSTCSIQTTVNALIPDYPVQAGARSIWEIGRLQVADAGADGDAATAADNMPFLRQGVFVP
jgi:Tol biopolymer transport system component